MPGGAGRPRRQYRRDGFITQAPVVAAGPGRRSRLLVMCCSLCGIARRECAAQVNSDRTNSSNSAAPSAMPPRNLDEREPEGGRNGVGAVARWSTASEMLCRESRSISPESRNTPRHPVHCSISTPCGLTAVSDLSRQTGQTRSVGAGSASRSVARAGDWPVRRSAWPRYSVILARSNQIPLHEQQT